MKCWQTDRKMEKSWTLSVNKILFVLHIMYIDQQCIYIINSYLFMLVYAAIEDIVTTKTAT